MFLFRTQTLDEPVNTNKMSEQNGRDGSSRALNT